MNAVPIDLAERGWVPDPLLRWGIRRLLRRRLADEVPADADARERRLAELQRAIDAAPVAPHADAANAQHYEVPPAFFEEMLGPRLKYSCCWWDGTTPDLAAAEEAMLRLTAERAGLADGQRVLELGCGWGSLTLWIAERYPGARVEAVSNSKDQRAFVEARARERGLDGRVTVRPADMNDFRADGRYDRVVSVEMFEHMRNYRALLDRIAGWLEPDGRLFVHLFHHRDVGYPFEERGDADWMARHFFRGGLMPSDDLLSRFPDALRVERTWTVSGLHYRRTLEAWLERLDARRDRARAALAGADLPPGTDPDRALQRWRMFLLACSELFGWEGGDVWRVGHYRLRPR